MAASARSKAPRRPSRLRIGHLNYDVHGSHDLDGQLIEEGLCGTSNGNLQKIIVRADLPHPSQAETLLHEVLHQCLFVTGAELERSLEESIVRAMSMALYGVLQDNPKLVAFLLHKE